MSEITLKIVEATVSRRRILLLNGPNLGALGTRLPSVYGRKTLAEIVADVVSLGDELGYEISHLQSNSEGELIDRIHQAAQEVDGIIINPGAYGHTSIALRDAIESVSLPTIEVHLSNIYAREEFRRHTYLSEIVKGGVVGFGAQGYLLALEGLVDYLEREGGV